SKDPNAPRLDPLGALLSIVSLSIILYAIIEAPDQGWGSSGTVTKLVVGLVLLAVFIVWELRTDHPMLDVRFFEKPRFTAAAAAITLVFFAMFGSLFLQTQYFQFVLGYSPLETGIRMLPFAAAMMITAPLSSRVVQRIGTKFTVAIGLGLVTTGLIALTGLQADTPYGNIFWRLMLMSAGMGFTMAPATESVMGSLPIFKAGVGSAVNDTTRQIGGALGVAIVGSVLATTYSDRMGPILSTLPPAASAAGNSIGAAQAIARSLPEQMAGVSTALIAASKSAFVTAMHQGVLVAAAATLLGVVLVLVFLPATARDEELGEQDFEFATEHAGEFPMPASVDLDAPRDPDFGLPHRSGE
ncbi:MAG: MFS transporter, partial [Actinobacteria bacterium]|nr:MFS transporter [Actinomycetota bacterium]